jgi:hypothetical protein
MRRRWLTVLLLLLCALVAFMALWRAPVDRSRQVPVASPPPNVSGAPPRVDGPLIDEPGPPAAAGPPPAGGHIVPVEQLDLQCGPQHDEIAAAMMVGAGYCEDAMAAASCVAPELPPKDFQRVKIVERLTRVADKCGLPPGSIILNCVELPCSVYSKQVAILDSACGELARFRETIIIESYPGEWIPTHAESDDGTPAFELDLSRSALRWPAKIALSNRAEEGGVPDPASQAVIWAIAPNCGDRERLLDQYHDPIAICEA